MSALDVIEAETPLKALRATPRVFHELPNGATFRFWQMRDDPNALLYIKIGANEATLGGSRHFEIKPLTRVQPVGHVDRGPMPEAETPKGALQQQPRTFGEAPIDTCFTVNKGAEWPVILIKTGSRTAVTFIGGKRGDYVWQFGSTDLIDVVPCPTQEAEDPKDFLRKLSQNYSPGKDMNFGFAVMTPEQYEIEDTAHDLGIALDWDQINADISLIERNAMKVLNNLGIGTSDEGHDGEGDLIGSAWTNSNTPGWTIIKKVAEGDDNYIWGIDRFIQLAYRGVEHDLMNGVSEQGKQVLDVRVEFFDQSGMFEGKEDPKAVFKSAISGSKPSDNPVVNEVLEYMPQDFIDAFKTKKKAEWHNPHAADMDWWPTFDDDNDSWYQVIYYFNYYTENGKLYALSMEGDTDGNHDTLEDAEVGTQAYEDLVSCFRHEEHQRAMRQYWQWVAQRGEDPLNYLMVPTHEVEKEFLVGFVKEGDKLKMVALRKLGQTPPAKPLSLEQATAAAAEDADVKKALEYCLLDPAGFTEATEEQVIADGGAWDKKQRLVLRFQWTDKEAAQDVATWIKEKAAQALAEE